MFQSFMAIPALKNEIIRSYQLVERNFFTTHIAATINHTSYTAEIVMAFDDEIDTNAKVIMEIF